MMNCNYLWFLNKFLTFDFDFDIQMCRISKGLRFNKKLSLYLPNMFAGYFHFDEYLLIYK